MSNITNSTSSSGDAGSVLAPIAGIFVFLGFFLCIYVVRRENKDLLCEMEERKDIIQYHEHSCQKYQRQ